MSILGTTPPTIQEMLDIRHFFPDGCYFQWTGSDQVPEGSLILFREYKDKNMREICKGCNIHDCAVRVTPDPNSK